MKPSVYLTNIGKIFPDISTASAFYLSTMFLLRNIRYRRVATLCSRVIFSGTINSTVLCRVVVSIWKLLHLHCPVQISLFSSSYCIGITKCHIGAFVTFVRSFWNGMTNDPLVSMAHESYIPLVSWMTSFVLV